MGVATSVTVDEEKNKSNTKSLHMGFNHQNKKVKLNYMLPDNCLHGNFKYFAMLIKNDSKPYENIMSKTYLKKAFKKYGFLDELLDKALATCEKFDDNSVDIDEFMENMRHTQKKLLIELFAPRNIDVSEVKMKIKKLCPLVEHAELEQRVDDYFKHSAVARKIKVTESFKARKMPILCADEVESSDGGISDEELDQPTWDTTHDIKEILSHYNEYDEIVNQFFHSENEINLQMVLALVQEVEKQLGDKPVLDVSTPCTVVGDIHAYWESLVRVFEINGHPKDTKYVFLGDYVDRGPKGIECLLLLYSFYVKYPENIRMIRGNHEDFRINLKYGFGRDCRQYDPSNKLFAILTRVFPHLAFAAIIDGHILCVHGGIPRKVTSNKCLIEELRKVKLPIADCLTKTDALNHCLGEMLWNDPHDDLGWGRNLVRGPGFYEFGHDILYQYLCENNCTHMIRGHEICEVGFHIHKNRRCITVFTAANYQQKRNFGATLSIHKNGLGIFTVVK